MVQTDVGQSRQLKHSESLACSEREVLELTGPEEKQVWPEVVDFRQSLRQVIAPNVLLILCYGHADFAGL